MLTFDGVAFRRDGVREIPRVLHAGDLACCWVEGQQDLVGHAFADARAAGYTTLRTWTSLDWVKPTAYWSPRALRPSEAATRAALEACLQAGADAGLAWHVALGDAAGVPEADLETYWRWLTDLVASHPDWFDLIEGLNEAWQNGASDPATIDGWMQGCRAKNPHHLHSLSSPQSVETLRKWTPAWCPIINTHIARGGHWGVQMKAAFDLGYQDLVRRNGWSGEPPGINWGDHNFVSVMQYPADWTDQPWRYQLYLAQTALSRQVPTYMSSPGVKLSGLRFTDVPGWSNALDLIDRLPGDLMAFARLFHGGITWKESRILAATDGCRVDHAIDDDGRAVMTVYPIDPMLARQTFAVARSWTGTCHQPAGAQPLTLRAGETWSADVSSGALLVGKLGAPAKTRRAPGW